MNLSITETDAPPYQYYSIATIVVVPSRIEPFGMVALEAGLSKIPVIASNVGGLPEIITDSETGYLFPLEDYEQLALKIEAVLKNAEQSKILAENLYNKVKSNFSSELMVENYFKIYTQLLQ